MGEGIEAGEGKEKGMIVLETENGYIAYQVKSSIIIGLPKGCRKLTDAELTTLYGYNINQLALIARILQKENLPPERVAEALSDMGSIVAMAYDEFTESLRKAVEQCTI